MFCRKCGNDIPDNSEFCFKCVAAIVIDDEKCDLEIEITGDARAVI